MSERSKLTRKLDDICRDAVRQRDNWTCQWCGKKVDSHNAHCSHVIPRSRGNALRWDLRNLKLLCHHCHINLWHKDPLSTDWFKQKFPDRYEYLQAHRYDKVKYSICELRELVEEKKKELQ